MARSTWTERGIPDLAGRRAIVTGASSGIGLEASRLLAAAGAEVVLAVRDPARGRRAVEEITRTVPEARLAMAEIDLSELDSVRRFGRREVELARGLDMLINNAGTSGGPRRASADGFEIQMATNFLGHFALTGLLLPLLHPGGRIVTVASLMARRGHLSAATTLEDLRPREPYRAGRCYAVSKQADLLFAVELAHRLRGHRSGSGGRRARRARWHRPRAGPSHGGPGLRERSGRCCCCPSVGARPGGDGGGIRRHLSSRHADLATLPDVTA